MTKSKDIHLDGITGDIKLENENGLVEVHADKLPLGTMSIANSNGDVKVAVPAKAQFEVEARAQNGEISSDFDAIKVQTNGDNSQATGSNGRRIQTTHLQRTRKRGHSQNHLNRFSDSTENPGCGWGFAILANLCNNLPDLSTVKKLVQKLVARIFQIR